MRERLERHQAWIYLLAILTGMALGGVFPAFTHSWEPLLWPLLGCLLYATFTQVPLLNLPAVFRDRGFLMALVLGNFVVMPAVVAALLWLVPDVPALKLGVLLVLLVPCTDWFISFAHLGRGDGRRAIAATPILLLGQLSLLPFYLWLMMGSLTLELAVSGHLFSAFSGLIVLPLILAWLTERSAPRSAPVRRWLAACGRLPVPLLAMVVFVIASTQVALVLELKSVLGHMLLVFVLYLIAAAGVGKLLGFLFELNAPAARTLVFSFGTRNSFVVLPLALALPNPWQAAVVVIVFQSLVELFGMIAYLAWVPRFLVAGDSDWADSEQ